LKHHSKLTLSERKLLAGWISDGKSKRECGRLLGKSHSTVVRELQRNRFKGGVYEPLHAQATFENNKKKAWSVKHPLKNKDVFAYVIDHLRYGWSPEQISGRLREVDHVDEAYWQINHETIYQYIYSGKWINQKDEPLFEYLRRKQKKRYKKGGRSVHSLKIPDRVSIHDRPKEVDARIVPGHWEGDSVVGKGHKSGLHTEYERVTSLIRMEKVERVNSEETIKAQLNIFSSLPPALRKSTTLDNGFEQFQHTKLETVGMATYFADPYCSQQRGGNENANLWIRYYFPKKTDFSKITNEEIKDVEWELNNRPRKRLKYRSPQEVFNFYLVQL
jgi:transposase, IS30 family